MKNPFIFLAFANDKADNSRSLRNLPIKAGAAEMHFLSVKEQEMPEAGPKKHKRRPVRTAGMTLLSLILIMTAAGFFCPQVHAQKQVRVLAFKIFLLSQLLVTA